MAVKDRFYEIDLLRFLAALAVVLYHYTFRGFAEGGYSPVEYPLLGEVFKYGTYGVQLFFMISGFVILMTASKRDAAHFVISRITRLYPAFWVCVSFTALFIVWKGGGLFQVGWLQYLLNLTMISGFAGVEMVDGVYWTLLVEMKFYALIFVLLMFRRIHQIEWFLAAWLAITVASLVLPLPRLVTFIFLTDWSAFFIAGALFYLVRQQGLNLSRGLMLWLSFVLALFQNLQLIIELEKVYQSDFSVYVSSFLITAFYLIFVLIAVGKSQRFSAHYMVKLGVLTYPLYLIHQNIGFMVYQAVGDQLDPYLLLAGLVIVMMLVAWLIHQLIERPLGRAMNRWLTARWEALAPRLGEKTAPSVS